MSSSTSPYNLIDGFEVLKQGRQNSVDILGIVSNISCSDDAQRCQIWLLDESLHDHSILSSPQPQSQSPFSNNNASARIVLYGSSEVARVVEQENLRPGDILRLNRVVLKGSTNIINNNINNNNNNNRDGDSWSSDGTTGKGKGCKTWEGSLQFQFSSHDSEPGLSWYCLGCIDSHGKFIEKNRIPENMITSKEIIKRLVDWYNNHSNHRSPSGYPSIDSNIESSTSTIYRGRNSHLTTLPCRKRTLDEIYNTVGCTSNIQIRVKQYYSQPATVVVNTGRTYGKNKKRHHKIFPPVVFAVVTDYSGTIMSFIDTTGRFLSKLKSAKNDNSNKKFLLLTNVSTVYQNSLQGLKSSSKEIVLVPTKTTSGLLISEHDKHNKEGSSSTISVSNSGQETQEEIIPDMEMNVISSLVDIHIGGISLKDICINNSDQSIFSSSTQYLKTILENNGRHAYKSAIIYFDNDDDIGQAIANPDVMKSLCGSLDVAELLDNNDTLCIHSMRFLRALLLEHVIVKWTIYVDDDNELKIAKAVLHQLSE
ncbi:MAG: hypothetical protein ACI90V_009035 [Bacillariaceae sp.]|jgi:hypothetical protein